MASSAEESRSLIVGVDGGGTKTVAWLALRDALPGQVLGRGLAGPSNPCSIGFTPAMRNLEESIEVALAEAGRRREEIVSACIGLAGISFESEGRRIPDWIRQQRLAREVIVTNDAEPILTCGAPGGWGVGLISGTGSFVLARSATGQMARVGGWGFRLGDEGSGYAIATAGLSAAARAADGRGPATVLLDRFLEHFESQQPRQLIERVYAHDVDRCAIADTARIVFDAAGEDPLADQIVSDAAQSLAEMIFAARRTLALPADLPIGVAGGAILGSTLLRARFIERLAACDVRPAPLTEVHEPVAGAVLMAREASCGRKTPR